MWENFQLKKENRGIDSRANDQKPLKISVTAQIGEEIEEYKSKYVCTCTYLTLIYLDFLTFLTAENMGSNKG